MSRGVESHLGLLFNDAMFTEIQFAGIDTFQ